ncbi:uncharacterized protein LOC21399850 [Morus notabilis]|uniref:uncharacterized protein LOC21399850 n=1 Tax=Morus notabilis TaxID=981085 RepID=UPI000CED0EC2|nr:uncharacterized protein LOC21399850 [Morus notabilis]
MSESSEIVTKETDPKEPRNVFALFAKFKLPLPFLKPKDGPVAEDGPREPVVSDGGTESRKVDFVRIPKAQVAVPPPVAVENEEANKTSNPIILWQVYALGGFMVMRWIWARWNERKGRKENSSEDDDDEHLDE